MHSWFCHYIELLEPVILGCCHFTMYRSDSLEQNCNHECLQFAAETGDVSLTHWSQSIACGIKRSLLLLSHVSCISLQAWCLCRYFYEAQCHCYFWGQLMGDELFCIDEKCCCTVVLLGFLSTPDQSWGPVLLWCWWKARITSPIYVIALTSSSGKYIIGRLPSCFLCFSWQSPWCAEYRCLWL